MLVREAAKHWLAATAALLNLLLTHLVPRWLLPLLSLFPQPQPMSPAAQCLKGPKHGMYADHFQKRPGGPVKQGLTP